MKKSRKEYQRDYARKYYAKKRLDPEFRKRINQFNRERYHKVIKKDPQIIKKRKLSAKKFYLKQENKDKRNSYQRKRYHAKLKNNPEYMDKARARAKRYYNKMSEDPEYKDKRKFYDRRRKLRDKGWKSSYFSFISKP